MITRAKANAVVGCTGEWTVTRGVTITVRIMDARTVFGRNDYLITPIAGSGEQWVEEYKVRLQADR